MASGDKEVSGYRRCPICGEKTDLAFRPFCSKRCRDIDLARWLGDGYAIPGGAPEGDDDDDGGAPSVGRGEGPDDDGGG